MVLTRRRISTAGLLLVLAGTIGFAAVPGASAGAPPTPPTMPGVTTVMPGTPAPGAGPDSSFGSCTIGFCIWDNANYSGTFTFWANSVYPYTSENTWHYVGNAYNDIASSLYNDRNLSTYISADYPPSNNWYCLPQFSVASNLADDYWPNGSDMNDTLSSFNILSSNAC
jgi:hypothetical protein